MEWMVRIAVITASFALLYFNVRWFKSHLDRTHGRPRAIRIVLFFVLMIAGLIALGVAGGAFFLAALFSAGAVLLIGINVYLVHQRDVRGAGPSPIHGIPAVLISVAAVIFLLLSTHRQDIRLWITPIVVGAFAIDFGSVILFDAIWRRTGTLFKRKGPDSRKDSGAEK